MNANPEFCAGFPARRVERVSGARQNIPRIILNRPTSKQTHDHETQRCFGLRLGEPQNPERLPSLKLLQGDRDDLHII